MNLPLPTQYPAREKPASTRRIGSCMTYRSDIVWINITDKSNDILTVIKAHKTLDYFPVCANKIDAVIGILSARDYLQSRLEEPPPNVQTILTKPLFVPESQTIERTLTLLNEQKTNAACVIDEYGGILHPCRLPTCTIWSYSASRRQYRYRIVYLHDTRYARTAHRTDFAKEKKYREPLNTSIFKRYPTAFDVRYISDTFTANVLSR